LIVFPALRSVINQNPAIIMTRSRENGPTEVLSP